MHMHMKNTVTEDGPLQYLAAVMLLDGAVTIPGSPQHPPDAVSGSGYPARKSENSRRQLAAAVAAPTRNCRQAK
jgi:hypothetical protein